MPEQVPPGE